MGINERMEQQLNLVLEAREQIGLWRDELRDALSELDDLAGDLETAQADLQLGAHHLEIALDVISQQV